MEASVDDDASICDALPIGRQLHWQDIEILEAANGEAGLDVFFESPPDLMLLDVSMPCMSGFEVLKQIRLVSDVPVILVTSRDEEMDQVHGLELGADEYRIHPDGARSRLSPHQR